MNLSPLLEGGGSFSSPILERGGGELFNLIASFRGWGSILSPGFEWGVQSYHQV